MNDNPTVPCKWCRGPTWHTGTGCCDNCWELHSRIERDPHLAARILNSVKGPAPSKEFQNVFDFHAKFDLLRHEKPGHLTKRKLKERVEFMLEELLEFTGAAGLALEVKPQWASPDMQRLVGHEVNVHDKPLDVQRLDDQADALVDLVYVTMGTAVMLGLPWDWLWDDVQRANMEKVRGMTKRGHAVDVTKPPGWKGPQTRRILDIAGYNQEEAHRDDAQRDS